MRFDYSARALAGKERLLQRAFEVLPGLTSWTALIGMIALSFLKPFLAAVIIIAFDLYWLLRLFYTTFFLVLSYALLAKESRTDWMKELAALGEGRYSDISSGRRRRESKALAGDAMPSLDAIRHLVIVPMVKEGEDVVAPGLEILARQTFPSSRILVVLAVEARASVEVHRAAQRMMIRYRRHFMDFLVATHPDGLPHEGRVKGANVTFAARSAAAWFREREIRFDDVVVSCFDADTVVSPQYFACLTYHFMACPKRTRASFQPIPTYNNNIWEAPGFSRVLESASSFFLLIEATDSEKLVTFSSHSMSFKALHEVGYWPVDMISDDSAIYWKAFIHFDGDYHVVPMYITVSMDAVAGPNWWTTASNVYKQKRRWAWGVENFPLVARAFLRADRIPWRKRAGHLFKLFEGHVAWATWAFMLTFIGWLPVLFASKQFSQGVLYYTSQRITGTIFNLSLLSFLISIALSLLLLPKKKERHSLVRRAVFALEWMAVPLIAAFFGALPALDTQTRMMAGSRLEFWVTDKARTKPRPRSKIKSN